MNNSENQPKPILSMDEWTEPEKWVWEKVCEGEIASFNLRYEKDLDPANIEEWTDDRIVSPQFLEAILLHEPYRSTLPRRGVRIVGAWIKEKLDLFNGSLTTEWRMEKSRFENDVILEYLRTSNLISFHGSLF